MSAACRVRSRRARRGHRDARALRRRSSRGLGVVGVGCRRRPRRILPVTPGQTPGAGGRRPADGSGAGGAVGRCRAPPQLARDVGDHRRPAARSRAELTHAPGGYLMRILVFAGGNSFAISDPVWQPHPDNPDVIVTRHAPTGSPSAPLAGISPEDLATRGIDPTPFIELGFFDTTPA